MIKKGVAEIMNVKNTEVQLRLKKIRQRMQEEKIDAWIVLSSDYHESEYVGEYFKCREYISGFTGSAGSIVILKAEAGLWTDGRYFLQAEDELQGSGITLYRKGEENVSELEEYLIQKLPENAAVGVDGRTISVSAYRKMKEKLDKKKIMIRLDLDLVGDIWQNRPAMSHRQAWELDINYAGVSRDEKLSMLWREIEKKGADCTIISSLDDIAWTLNIRGSDVACTPVVLSFLLIRKTDAIWFVQKEAVNETLKEKLQQDKVTIQSYYDIYQFLQKELKHKIIYLDPDRTNMLIFKMVKERKIIQRGSILEGKNLTLLPKAVKNQTEIENMRKAHIKDAAACIKFIYWLKTNVQKKKKGKNFGNVKDIGGHLDYGEHVTEIMAAKKLEEFRMEQEHYLGPSFDTIVGYAQHGAIIHYSAGPNTDLTLEAENFVLIDSGGHYLEGTTDITRTIALGPLTYEQKHYYTLVLKGNLRLAASKFKYGCAGINLDCLAREALWKNGLDYNHGTGHGVGYLLSVHEAPNCFRNRISESGNEAVRLEPGMITSNEPGVYLTGKYGIRLENLVLCKELEKNEFGRFLGFETLTLVPFERDAIIAEEMEHWEREWLNLYHARIRKEIGEYLDDEEAAWLKEATAEL